MLKNAKVINLFEKLDVKLITIKDYIWETGLDGINATMGSEGLYNARLDAITLNPIGATDKHYPNNPLTQVNRDLIALHELGHWTGHADRLNRRGVGNDAEAYLTDIEVMHTEEAIAQLVCLELAHALDVTRKEASEFSNVFFSQIYDCNYMEAKRQAKKASAYILELASKTELKAA